MNSAKKQYHGGSLSLLFISLCSGFTASHYQIIWHKWLISQPGFKFLSIYLTLLLILVSLPVGCRIGTRLLPALPRNTMMTIFVTLELLLVAFALFSKFILYKRLPERNLIQPFQYFSIFSTLFFAMFLPPVLISSSISLLSRIFRKQKYDLVKSLYLYYVIGVVISLLISSMLHIDFMGVENSMHLGAFLNFSCAAIAAMHFCFTCEPQTPDRKPAS